jgi:hypothetical protein
MKRNERMLENIGITGSRVLSPLQDRNNSQKGAIIVEVVRNALHRGCVNLTSHFRKRQHERSAQHIDLGFFLGNARVTRFEYDPTFNNTKYRLIGRDERGCKWAVIVATDLSNLWADFVTIFRI